jgi:CheY-like chemotaxis protein
MIAEDVQVELILAEDDDGHAELITDNLQLAGFDGRVRRAVNGYEALQLAAASMVERRPFLMLLDLNMPEHDGYEVLQSLRDVPKLRTAPVIVFTSSDRPTEIERCYDLGCNLYLTKPVTVVDFTRSVRLIAELAALARFPTGTVTGCGMAAPYRA